MPQRPTGEAIEEILQRTGGAFTIFHDNAAELDVIINTGMEFDEGVNAPACTDAMYVPRNV